MYVPSQQKIQVPLALKCSDLFSNLNNIQNNFTETLRNDGSLEGLSFILKIALYVNTVAFNSAKLPNGQFKVFK